MERQYHMIGGDGQEYGPVSAQQLRQWLAEGRLDAQTQVRAEDTADWQPMSAFPEILPSEAPGSAPAPPPSACPPPLPRTHQRVEDDLGMRMLLPVGRSILAIIAGYLGLISILIVPAPFAVLLGILAIREIQKSHNTPKPKYGLGRAIFGIVMGAIFTIFGVFFVLAPA